VARSKELTVFGGAINNQAWYDYLI